MSNSSLPSSFFKVIELGLDNWHYWKCHITAILRDRGLTGYADGSITKSPAGPESQSLVADWVARDGTAKTVIELTLIKSESSHITRCKTATEMWKALRVVKEGRGRNGLLRARQTFFRANMTESDNLVQHTSAILHLVLAILIRGFKLKKH